jgi:hypothetical protein
MAPQYELQNIERMIKLLSRGDPKAVAIALQWAKREWNETEISVGLIVLYWLYFSEEVLSG